MTKVENNLKYGMVGGGEGSFIGDVHRKALGLVGKAELVCGCFDINRENNVLSGLKYGLDEKRIYGSYTEMAEVESSNPDKPDFIIIVTPNILHFPAAKEFLSKDFNVICEKPLCFEVEEAEELKRLADEKGLLFGIMYTYIGYPMVKQARHMVRGGDIGDITVVMAEYAQAWMGELCEKTDGKPAIWRNDPKMNGRSGAVGDIGTHIECAVTYITGLKIASLCANLRAIGRGTKLDTNAEILVKYDSGASGMYWCSQVAYGHNNGLKIRIFGTKGSIEWEQEDPCKLKVCILGKPMQILTQGKDYLSESVRKYCRLPAGHPEGFYEAFANIYTAFTMALLKQKSGLGITAQDKDFAGIDEGLSGVRFIDACVSSSQKNSGWIEY
ncbi:MAG TPA: Gfo/Idh/MocA family oxidoreductase [Ruminiclostridium sp.]